jgi:hypothetical protein
MNIQPGEPMKSTIIALSLALAAMAAAITAHADDAAGSNANGNEKVCFVGANAQNEQGLADALKSCKRGDILDIGWLQTPIAMQLCDFNKAVLYHPTKGSVIACVYAGTRRPVSK